MNIKEWARLKKTDNLIAFEVEAMAGGDRAEMDRIVDNQTSHEVERVTLKMSGLGVSIPCLEWGGKNILDVIATLEK